MLSPFEEKYHELLSNCVSWPQYKWVSHHFLKLVGDIHRGHFFWEEIPTCPASWVWSEVWTSPFMIFSPHLTFPRCLGWQVAHSLPCLSATLLRVFWPASVWKFPTVSFLSSRKRASCVVIGRTKITRTMGCYFGNERLQFLCPPIVPVSHRLVALSTGCRCDRSPGQGQWILREAQCPMLSGSFFDSQCELATEEWS